MKHVMLRMNGRQFFDVALDALLKENGSLIMSAKNVKKDGSVRFWNFQPRIGRAGTPTGEKMRTGSGMKFDPRSRGMLPVVDLAKYREIVRYGKETGMPVDPSGAWRMISFDTLEWIQYCGVRFHFNCENGGDLNPYYTNPRNR